MKSISCIVGLSIAGFDPSGGAGILADLKTFSAYELYAQACITGLTVQSTDGVQTVRVIDPDWVTQTLAELAKDNNFAVIKLGALFSRDIAEVVAHFLRQHAVPVVCDPVIRATSGASLLDSEGIRCLQADIVPLCAWITPNWAELAVLADAPVADRSQAEGAARKLQASFPQVTVLVTGGDQPSPDDLLLVPGCTPQWIAGNRIETRATHGTGCTLSSALAARLALYPAERPAERVAACKRYVEGAMRHAPALGRGPGPVNHFWNVRFSEKTDRLAVRRSTAIFSAASGGTSTKRRT